MLSISKSFDASNPISIAELRERRKSSPVTLDAIEMQAKLFECSRKALAWASSQESLKVMESEEYKNINIVIPVKDPKDTDQTIAYFKMGRKSSDSSKEITLLDSKEVFDSSIGIMEELVWQTSLILGIEKNFAPTKSVNLKLKGSSQPYEVELQAAVSGTLLHKHERPLVMTQAIQATLCMLVFGMRDCHSANMIVDDHGRIRFFDNTRSLPHSNGLIFSHKMVVTFKSALWALECMYQEFSKEEYSEIKEQINQLLTKKNDFEKYLTRPSTVKRISKLPYGWFSTKEVLTAFNERMDNLKYAINNLNIKNLRDLCFATIPDFRFISMLKLIAGSKTIGEQLSFKELQLKYMYCGGVNWYFGELEQEIECMRYPNERDPRDFNVPVQAIYDVTKNNTMSFEEQFKYLSEFKGVKESDKEYFSIMGRCSKRAKIDFKDFPREECPTVLLRSFIDKRLSLFYHRSAFSKTKIDKSTLDKWYNYTQREHLVIFHGNEENILTALYKNKFGVKCSIPIDYHSVMGCFKFKLPQDQTETVVSIEESEKILLERLDSIRKQKWYSRVISYFKKKK